MRGLQAFHASATVAEAGYALVLSFDDVSAADDEDEEEDEGILAVRVSSVPVQGREGAVVSVRTASVSSVPIVNVRCDCCCEEASVDDLTESVAFESLDNAVNKPRRECDLARD